MAKKGRFYLEFPNGPIFTGHQSVFSEIREREFFRCGA
ncbi:hypothetical protein A343_1478 [Porphyromonas gingivalis JCVI SC001]|nr:hypothetical protein A343_1478 [Porphyromonas gingivalis JCVI SC001]